MKESTLKRFLRMAEFSEHLELHRLDSLSASGRLENFEFARRKLAEFSEERLQPAPLLNGADLIAMGYQPGPRFSQILRTLEDAQLEGTIAIREEALDLVSALFPLGG